MNSYYRKLRLGNLIVESLKNKSVDNSSKSSKYYHIYKIHGILERNIKIIEVPNGFEVYVPMAYGEEYVEECIKEATEIFLRELEDEGELKEYGKDL